MAIPSAILLIFVYHLINFKALALVVMAAFLIGGVFDIWATRQSKKDNFFLWEYNTKTTFNKKLMGMEVEDVTLFLSLTPVFTVATWEGAKEFVSIYDIPTLPLLLCGAVVIYFAYKFTLKISRPSVKKRKR